MSVLPSAMSGICTDLVAIEHHMTGVVHVLSVLCRMHVGADRSGRDMIVMTERHMMVLLEGFKVLSGGYLT